MLYKSRATTQTLSVVFAARLGRAVQRQALGISGEGGFAPAQTVALLPGFERNAVYLDQYSEGRSCVPVQCILQKLPASGPLLI